MMVITPACTPVRMADADLLQLLRRSWSGDLQAFSVLRAATDDFVRSGVGSQHADLIEEIVVQTYVLLRECGDHVDPGQGGWEVLVDQTAAAWRSVTAARSAGAVVR